MTGCPCIGADRSRNGIRIHLCGVVGQRNADLCAAQRLRWQHQPFVIVSSHHRGRGSRLVESLNRLDTCCAFAGPGNIFVLVNVDGSTRYDIRELHSRHMVACSPRTSGLDLYGAQAVLESQGYKTDIR